MWLVHPTQLGQLRPRAIGPRVWRRRWRTVEEAAQFGPTVAGKDIVTQELAGRLVGKEAFYPAGMGLVGRTGIGVTQIQSSSSECGIEPMDSFASIRRATAQALEIGRSEPIFEIAFQRERPGIERPFG